jgi:hypothetical protein
MHYQIFHFKLKKKQKAYWQNRSHPANARFSNGLNAAGQFKVPSRISQSGPFFNFSE